MRVVPVRTDSEVPAAFRLSCLRCARLVGVLAALDPWAPVSGVGWPCHVSLRSDRRGTSGIIGTPWAAAGAPRARRPVLPLSWQRRVTRAPLGDATHDGRFDLLGEEKRERGERRGQYLQFPRCGCLTCVVLSPMLFSSEQAGVCLPPGTGAGWRRPAVGRYLCPLLTGGTADTAGAGQGLSG